MFYAFTLLNINYRQRQEFFFLERSFSGITLFNVAEGRGEGGEEAGMKIVGKNSSVGFVEFACWISKLKFEGNVTQFLGKSLTTDCEWGAWGFSKCIFQLPSLTNLIEICWSFYKTRETSWKPTKILRPTWNPRNFISVYSMLRFEAWIQNHHPSSQWPTIKQQKTLQTRFCNRFS